MRLLRNVDVKSKCVGLRLDLNVPVENKKVIDASRISASIKTIQYLLENNCRIIIFSHFGRPTEGSYDKRFSLEIVREELSKHLSREVVLIQSLSEKDSHQKNKILLHENVRFMSGELDNSEDLGKALNEGLDMYIFDAFGAAHRKHASTNAAILNSKQSCAGFLVEQEVSALQQALDCFEEPLISIVGGSKVSTKLGVIERLSEISNFVITGGGITNTFLAAKGLEVGKSLIEESMINQAKMILDNGNILLPKRVIVAASLEDQPIEKEISEVQSNEMILDQCISRDIQDHILLARTIIWNGPIGVFENNSFSNGTAHLSKLIADAKAFSVAGGGETIAAINKFISNSDVSYCSTAGGAFLEFLEGKELPSLIALGYQN